MVVEAESHLPSRQTSTVNGNRTKKTLATSSRTKIAKVAAFSPVQDCFEERCDLFLQYFNPCRLAPSSQVHMQRTKSFTDSRETSASNGRMRDMLSNGTKCLFVLVIHSVPFSLTPSYGLFCRLRLMELSRRQHGGQEVEQQT